MDDSARRRLTRTAVAVAASLAVVANFPAGVAATICLPAGRSNASLDEGSPDKGRADA